MLQAGERCTLRQGRAPSIARAAALAVGPSTVAFRACRASWRTCALRCCSPPSTARCAKAWTRCGASARCRMRRPSRQRRPTLRQALAQALHQALRCAPRRPAGSALRLRSSLVLLRPLLLPLWQHPAASSEASAAGRVAAGWGPSSAAAGADPVQIGSEPCSGAAGSGGGGRAGTAAKRLEGEPGALGQGDLRATCRRCRVRLPAGRCA